MMCLNAALCLQKRQMHSDAVKMCNEALSNKPDDNAKAHYRLYQSYKVLKDLDKAKNHLEQAIKMQPNDK